MLQDAASGKASDLGDQAGQVKDAAAQKGGELKVCMLMSDIVQLAAAHDTAYLCRGYVT